MPTPLDRAASQRVSTDSWNLVYVVGILDSFKPQRTNSIKAPFFAFAAIVTGVAAWSIWGQDLFPSRDPTGGNVFEVVSNARG